MSKNYLIGDLHLGHNDIHKKFRPEFYDEEDHNETIHENILMCSGKRNSLWLHGDICFKESQFEKLWVYRRYFQSVHVILGNHEHKRLVKYCIQNDIHVHGFIKKWGFWLSHCPIHPQELYRGKNIHGHVHNNTVPDERYFNVSCENLDYKPITLQAVQEIFKDREGVVQDG